MLKAVTRQAALVEAKIRALNASSRGQNQQPITTAYFFDHHVTAEDVAVMVTEQDFIDAHRELIPSVSAGELEHYERVRATFEGLREDKTKVQSNPRAAIAAGKRSVSGASRGSGKGKGKAVSKGKGKALAINSDDEYDEDWPDDEPEGGENGSHAKDKGKAVVPFRDGGASDDEGLYE